MPDEPCESCHAWTELEAGLTAERDALIDGIDALACWAQLLVDEAQTDEWFRERMKAKMLLTGELEGSHYAAATELLAERAAQATP